jgi:hypothetical protein
MSYIEHHQKDLVALLIGCAVGALPYLLRIGSRFVGGNRSSTDVFSLHGGSGEVEGHSEFCIEKTLL